MEQLQKGQKIFIFYFCQGIKGFIWIFLSQGLKCLEEVPPKSNSCRESYVIKQNIHLSERLKDLYKSETAIFKRCYHPALCQSMVFKI